tara:strand:- start:52 stop:372 length:321 start_codon:yes stop_codon:yes gene_type:complete
MSNKFTKEEIGYKPTDKIRQMWLLNPHDHHMLYVREDGSFYGFTHMKGEDPEEWFWEPDGIQIELFPPEPPKKIKVNEDAPHHNILERYYGKDWKPTPQEGLEDHF